jgi:hypothetical protein
MRIVVPAVNAKQALLALIFLSAVLLTFFATKAWGMPSESSPPPIAKPSLYDNYVKPKPATTTTSTTTTTIAPKPSTTIPAPVSVPPVSQASGDIWEALRNCEAGGNYSTNTGNGYFGAYQFSAATWRSMGTGYEFAHLAPPAIQDDAARRLQARSGWGQWPACTKKLGLR